MVPKCENPDLLFPWDDLATPWLMSRAERYTLESLVKEARPEVAIEIGTHLGGSLQLLAKYARKVYSIDCDPNCARELGPKYPNVVFHTGDSKAILPQVIREIQSRNEALGVVLIDGDHSEAGVKADIQAVLSHIPSCRCLVLMHDSFNPEVRRGILEAGWQESPYAHYLELDFVTGTMFNSYVASSVGSDIEGSMWGGLAVGIMTSKRRTGPLEILQFNERIFDASFLNSRYFRTRDKIAHLVQVVAQALRGSKKRFSPRKNAY